MNPVFLLFLGLSATQSVLANIVANETSHPTSRPSFRSTSFSPTHSPSEAFMITGTDQTTSDATNDTSSSDLFGLPAMTAGVIMGALGAIALISLLYIVQRSISISYKFSKLPLVDAPLGEEANKNPINSTATTSPERHGLVASASGKESLLETTIPIPTSSGKHSRHHSRL